MFINVTLNKSTVLYVSLHFFLKQSFVIEDCFFQLEWFCIGHSFQSCAPFLPIIWEKPLSIIDIVHYNPNLKCHRAVLYIAKKIRELVEKNRKYHTVVKLAIVLGLEQLNEMSLVQILFWRLPVYNELCSWRRRFIHIISVYPANNGYWHMLGVNMRWTSVIWITIFWIWIQIFC